MRRCQKDVVIRITKYSSIGSLDSTSKSALLQRIKEFEAVVAIGKPSQNFTLADPITDGKARGQLSVPSDIAVLMYIHEDDETEKHKAQVLHHLSEQDRKSAEIEGLSLIHGTAENFGAVSGEITDCFNDCPGAHVCRHAQLVSKLKIMEAE